MAPARSRLSAHANRPSRVPTELPDYQPPTHPLNLTAQQAIRDLPRTHKLDSLKSRLKAANLHLTDAAAEINDRFQEKNVQNERRKARRAAVMSSQESSEEADRELEEMQRATGMMTGDLERGVGKVIDAGEELKAVEQALQELNANVTAGRSAMTQSTLGASQFGQHQSIDNDDENEFVDRAASKGAADILKEKVEQHRAAYADFTMTERYASHNDYVGFKKMVHDAHYPAEEAPPMPHASTWFGEGAGTQTSSSNGPQGTQLDEDDDLVMASERISVKCPITLTEMRDPVSSTKCPHNFERQAFQEMLNNSELRVDGDGRRRTGTKAMRCPVAGCDMVSLNDGPYKCMPSMLTTSSLPHRFSKRVMCVPMPYLSARSNVHKRLSMHITSPSTTMKVLWHIHRKEEKQDIMMKRSTARHPQHHLKHRDE